MNNSCFLFHTQGIAQAIAYLNMISYSPTTLSSLYHSNINLIFIYFARKFGVDSIESQYSLLPPSILPIVRMLCQALMVAETIVICCFLPLLICDSLGYRFFRAKVLPDLLCHSQVKEYTWHTTYTSFFPVDRNYMNKELLRFGFMY